MTEIWRSFSPHDSAVRLLVEGLATYRLVKLVRDDRITEPFRKTIAETQGPPEQSKLSYLLNCPWCLSVYLGAAVTLAGRRWPGTADVLTRTLALSAITGLVTAHLDDADG
jgi:Protein of unknown function (DUF1360)